MKNSKASYEQLCEVPLPAKTDSYTPVPHKILIDTVRERLDAKGLRIVHEGYQINGKGEQMFGHFSVNVEGALEQNMSIGFRNSYDKSLAVGLVSGSRVIVCSNLMFEGDIKMLRKHTVNVFHDMEGIVTQAVDGCRRSFDNILEATSEWKEIPLKSQEMAEIAGRMFITEDIINSTQLNILKREINGSQFFKGETVWDFYNHCTEALKASHPSEIMQKHLALHTYTKESIVAYAAQ